MLYLTPELEAYSLHRLRLGRIISRISRIINSRTLERTRGGTKYRLLKHLLRLWSSKANLEGHPTPKAVQLIAHQLSEFDIIVVRVSGSRRGTEQDRGYAVLRAYLQSIGEDIEDIDEWCEATRFKRKTSSIVVAGKTSSQSIWMHNISTAKRIILASLQATTFTHASICLRFVGTANDAFSTTLGQWSQLLYDQMLSWTLAIALPADQRTEPPARAGELLSYLST